MVLFEYFWPLLDRSEFGLRLTENSVKESFEAIYLIEVIEVTQAMEVTRELKLVPEVEITVGSVEFVVESIGTVELGV